MLKSISGKVFYREWTCVTPKAVIILVHGMGGYSGRFFEMGPYLAKAGFQIYAPDQIGHGENPTTKGHVPNFKLMTADLKVLVDFAKTQNPGKKIFMFGESMGGLITIDFSIHHQSLLSGVVLMSPAVKDKMPMTTSKKLNIFISALFNPMKFFSADFSASLFTRDQVMQKRVDADKLEVRAFTARFYLAILKAMTFVNLMSWRLKLPFFMQLAGHDNMISAEAAEKFAKKTHSKDKTVKWYPEMYHALYVDKDRENTFRDMVAWLNARS